jgi:lactoylglutathione lyase
MSGEKTVNGITFRIRHTMMAVSDLDRSIDFYTRLFGMDIQRLRSAPERNERVAYVGYGSDDDSHALELIQIGASGEHSKMAPWSGHVAIFVSDLYKLCEKLKAEGVTFTQEPGPVRAGSKDLVAFVKDRDGYTLELTERHSKSGPPVKVT